MDELEIDFFLTKSPQEQALLKAKYREKGHLELKDLAMEDLEALTEAKNSDKRFDFLNYVPHAKTPNDWQDDDDEFFKNLFGEGDKDPQKVIDN